MKHRKRLAAVALALAVFFSLGINAYAEEIPAPTTEETSQAEIEPSTSTTEEVTPPAEDPPVTEEQETEESPIVYNIEELLTAIEAANDGDTILIGEKITCAESVTIGSLDKKITLAFADDFSGKAMFCLHTDNEQEITMQNLILNGKAADGISTHVVDVDLLSNPPDTQGAWLFDGVTFKNFNTTWSILVVYDADAIFHNCRFENNYGRRSGGIEIYPNASAEITYCTFYSNQSIGDGAAIRCCGNTTIKETSITGNHAVNNGTVKNGGGIYVETGASCEILSCTITGNVADLGGGVSCKGTLTVCDTLIYGNTGKLGGSDIKGFGGANIVVDYTDGMGAVYAENSPVGFYKDDFESTFDAETNAEFVGETISVQNNTNNNLGVKFIFEGDLPIATPEPTPDDDSSDLPQETPSDPIPDVPVSPDIEIDPIPTPEPDPDPVPVPTPPIDPPEESEDADTEESLPSDYEEEQTVPIVDTDNTEQKPEEEAPPATTTDKDSPIFEETEQEKQTVQETGAKEDSVIDSSALDTDNDAETEIPELPIGDEAAAETIQPEQEEHPIPAPIDKGEEQSFPWGIIIAAVTLLSASGAMWLIKRKR